MAKITDLSLSKITPPAKGQALHADGVVQGMYVRVSQGGSKTFVLVQGKERRFISLGRYGDVTLAQAREAARRLRAEKTLGRIIPSAMSLTEARTQYLAQLDIRASTRIYYERNLNRLKGPKLSDITPREINCILDALPRASRDQCLASFRAFFKWCLRRRYIEKSPCELMQLGEATSRDRVLSTEELQCIWRACERQRGQSPPGTAEKNPSEERETAPPSLPASFCAIVKLLILTGQRRTEIASLRSEWISTDKITLPKEITKNGRVHTFPIGTSGFTILTSLLSSLPPTGVTLLFPARGTTSKPFNGWSKSKAALDKLSGVTGWTLHDLRRTFATIHAQIGTAIHVTERLLNHISGTQAGIVGVYQRHNFMPEMRTAMERYETHLATLLNRRKEAA